MNVNYALSEKQEKLYRHIVKNKQVIYSKPVLKNKLKVDSIHGVTRSVNRLLTLSLVELKEINGDVYLTLPASTQSECSSQSTKDTPSEPLENHLVINSLPLSKTQINLDKFQSHLTFLNERPRLFKLFLYYYQKSMGNTNQILIFNFNEIKRLLKDCSESTILNYLNTLFSKRFFTKLSGNNEFRLKLDVLGKQVGDNLLYANFPSFVFEEEVYTPLIKRELKRLNTNELQLLHFLSEQDQTTDWLLLSDVEIQFNQSLPIKSSRMKRLMESNWISYHPHPQKIRLTLPPTVLQHVLRDQELRNLLTLTKKEGIPTHNYDKRFLIFDTENIRINELIQDLDLFNEKDVLVLLFTENSGRDRLTLQDFHFFNHAPFQFETFQVPVFKHGQNALDHALSVEIALKSMEYPNSQFIIISKDQGYLSALSHLRMRLNLKPDQLLLSDYHHLKA